MNPKYVIENTKSLIDDLKAVCSNAGLANSGGEYKIVTEAFLYKYLNDKFLYEVVLADSSLAGNTEEKLAGLSDDAYELLLMRLGAGTAHLKREHLLSSLFNRQNEEKFAELFDTTLQEISDLNLDRFSVQTGGAEKIRLFDPISPYVIEAGKRDGFCRALVNKLVRFSFADVFSETYDFFAAVFEYLISDYNKDSGQYGEYYTPNSIARIIAQVLVPERVQDVTVYDPAAGTGTLLLALVHRIGEDRCSLYSQDISQKSSEFLRLNLILNGKVDSLNNVVHGNTLTHPAVFGFARDRLPQFDYVVSNPPFNMDFSETWEELAGDVHKKRFFAGVPNVLKDKDDMKVYLLFLQHILASMKETGKAAVVVPTGFLTAQNGIEKKIREHIVERRMLKGVISMPPKIFATTGTNVSVLFLDRENRSGSAVLIDASKLGTKEKVGGLQRTLLSPAELDRIVQTFGAAENVEDFCQVVSFAEMEERNCSFSAGQYFDVKIEYIKLSQKEFVGKLTEHSSNLKKYLSDGEIMGENILRTLGGLYRE